MRSCVYGFARARGAVRSENDNAGVHDSLTANDSITYSRSLTGAVGYERHYPAQRDETGSPNHEAKGGVPHLWFIALGANMCSMIPFRTRFCSTSTSAQSQQSVHLGFCGRMSAKKKSENTILRPQTQVCCRQYHTRSQGGDQFRKHAQQQC